MQSREAEIEEASNSKLAAQQQELERHNSLASSYLYEKELDSKTIRELQDAFSSLTTNLEQVTDERDHYHKSNDIIIKEAAELAADLASLKRSIRRINETYEIADQEEDLLEIIKQMEILVGTSHINARIIEILKETMEFSGEEQDPLPKEEDVKEVEKEPASKTPTAETPQQVSSAADIVDIFQKGFNGLKRIGSFLGIQPPQTTPFELEIV